jgi:hypothetical protein
LNEDRFPHDKREIVFRADFDSIDEFDCVWVSLHLMRGPARPNPGDWVYLLDGRGGGCTGTCEAVHGWLAQIRPDWDAWLGEQIPPAKARRHLRAL